VLVLEPDVAPCQAAPASVPPAPDLLHSSIVERTYEAGQAA
jgi:hypothetical protein